MTSRTFGYVRVSTDDQKTALQVDALRKAGVDAEALFSDEGISGTRRADTRPGFAKLLAILVPGDTLTVYSISRVGRNAPDTLALIRGLTDRGIRFVSLTEQVDTATIPGRLMLTILAGVAEAERDTLVERTRAGLAAARARGTRLGAKPVTADIEARIRASLASGMSGRAAARDAGVSEKVARRVVWEGRLTRG